MGDTRNAYRILIGKPLGRQPLGRPIRRRDNCVKIHFSEMCCDAERRMKLSGDLVQYRTSVLAMLTGKILFTQLHIFSVD
jgi:hypothetical protein